MLTLYRCSHPKARWPCVQRPCEPKGPQESRARCKKVTQATEAESLQFSQCACAGSSATRGGAPGRRGGGCCGLERRGRASTISSANYPSASQGHLEEVPGRSNPRC